MINPNLRARDRIYSELPEDLKKLMEQHLLTEEEHEKVLKDIKYKSYYGKTPVEKPRFILVVGQTGSGKSNLTSSIYSKNPNVVIIDSDKYKAFRHDNINILRDHLVEYAFLTAPDAYLHRDEMIVDAMKSKYNILMECATSKKHGLFIDINNLQKAGYDVELSVLGVSSLNSLLSVHERYEALISISDNAAKLTNIDRHDDSFYSLYDCILNTQNIPDVKVSVYERGKNYPYIPTKIYSSSDTERRFSCATEALLYAQSKDGQETLKTFDRRYNIIKNQMTNRNAPKQQIEQLETIRTRYERSVENKKEYI